MSEKLFEDGKVITVDGVELECVAVIETAPEGQPNNFSYTFRVKAELDAEREAAKLNESEGEE